MFDDLTNEDGFKQDVQPKPIKKLGIVPKHRPAVMDIVHGLLLDAGLDYIILIGYPLPDEETRYVVDVEWSTENARIREMDQSMAVDCMASVFLDNLPTLFGDDIIKMLDSEGEDFDGET